MSVVGVHNSTRITTGNRAAQVDQEERFKRRDRLISLQQQVGQHKANKLIGKEIEVLVDGIDEDGCIIGRTQHDAPDIDNQVILSDNEDTSVPRLEAGQMRTCLVSSSFTGCVSPLHMSPEFLGLQHTALLTFQLGMQVTQNLTFDLVAHPIS